MFDADQEIPIAGPRLSLVLIESLLRSEPFHCLKFQTIFLESSWNNFQFIIFLFADILRIQTCPFRSLKHCFYYSEQCLRKTLYNSVNFITVSQHFFYFYYFISNLSPPETCMFFFNNVSLFLILFFHYCCGNIAIFDDIRLPPLSNFRIFFASS